MWMCAKKGEDFIAHRQKEMAGTKTDFRQAQTNQTWEAGRGNPPIFLASSVPVERRGRKTRFEKQVGAEVSICLGDLVLELRSDDGPATSVS
jgi:hypothetical protein